MSERRTYDLDAALEALARAERTARPAVSERLRARVLADAAELSPARSRQPAARGRAGGWLRWPRGLDLWAGAGVAAALLCLAIGLGVGYGAGETVLAEVGFEEVQVAQADDGDEELAFLSEDVL